MMRKNQHSLLSQRKLPLSISRLKDFGFSKEYLSEILDFCISEGLLYKGNHDRVFVSRKGFVHYGALFSLFYSNTQFSQKEKK